MKMGYFCLYFQANSLKAQLGIINKDSLKRKQVKWVIRFEILPCNSQSVYELPKEFTG